MSLKFADLNANKRHLFGNIRRLDTDHFEVLDGKKRYHVYPNSLVQIDDKGTNTVSLRLSWTDNEINLKRTVHDGKGKVVNKVYRSEGRPLFVSTTVYTGKGSVETISEGHLFSSVTQNGSRMIASYRDGGSFKGKKNPVSGFIGAKVDNNNNIEELGFFNDFGVLVYGKKFGVDGVTRDDHGVLQGPKNRFHADGSISNEVQPSRSERRRFGTTSAMEAFRKANE